MKLDEQRCLSCDAPVVFVKSATSERALILDAKPEKRVVLVLPGYPDRLPPPLGVPHPAARIVDTYVDHHATCPKAAEWKGRRRDRGR